MVDTSTATLGNAPAALRRSTFLARAAEAGVEVGPRAQAGSLIVDLDSYRVTFDGTEVEVSPRQVELLAVFASSPGRVWSRDQLHWMCWNDVSPSRRVDVQLCRIRAKLGVELFRNIRDRGWALRPTG